MSERVHACVCKYRGILFLTISNFSHLIATLERIFPVWRGVRWSEIPVIHAPFSPICRVRTGCLLIYEAGASGYAQSGCRESHGSSLSPEVM